MNSTITSEARTVEITLNSQVRSVDIVRLNGQSYWTAQCPILCRFKTGTKLHTNNYPTVDEVKPGVFAFRRNQIVANKNTRPYAFSDDLAATSNWKREHAVYTPIANLYV